MSTDTPTPSQAFTDDLRLLIVLDTQFAARGETDLDAEQMARLEAHDWIAEGHENGEYEVTDLGRSIIGRALGEPSGVSGQFTQAGRIVGWRMLGSVTVYTARGASGDMREFVALEDFQTAAAPTPPAGESPLPDWLLALIGNYGADRAGRHEAQALHSWQELMRGIKRYAAAAPRGTP